MTVTKGFKTSKVHDLVKRGYTKSHLANERKKKFKKMKLENGVRTHTGIVHGFQPGLEMGNNDMGGTEEQQ